MFALHRKGDCMISMSIFRRFFEFTLSSKDAPSATTTSTIARRIKAGE